MAFGLVAIATYVKKHSMGIARYDDVVYINVHKILSIRPISDIYADVKPDGTAITLDSEIYEIFLDDEHSYYTSRKEVEGLLAYSDRLAK